MVQDNKKRWSTIGSIILVVIFFGGYLGLFIKPNNSVNEITVGYNIFYNNEMSQIEYNNIAKDISLGNFLYNVVPGISFESDYDLKTVNNIGNDFLNDKYWQILINEIPTKDLNHILKDDEIILLYYGEILNIFNISVNLNMSGIFQNDNVLINGDTTLMNLLDSYQVNFTNQTINCLFGVCNENNNTWDILINNISTNNFNITFNKNDNLFFNYE